MARYNTEIDLVKEDLEFLNELEKILGKSIPRLPDVIWYDFGFSTYGDQINKLGLYNQKLLKLPKNIGQLTALEIIYVNRNELTILPDTICQLSSLKYLDLSRNQLTCLPECIGNLTSLSELYLKDNQLEILPKSFKHLTTLKKLDLSINKYTNFPPIFSHFNVLEEFELDRNPLITLPESLFDLPEKCLITLEFTPFFDDLLEFDIELYVQPIEPHTKSPPVELNHLQKIWNKYHESLQKRMERILEAKQNIPNTLMELFLRHYNIETLENLKKILLKASSEFYKNQIETIEATLHARESVKETN